MALTRQEISERLDALGRAVAALSLQVAEQPEDERGRIVRSRDDVVLPVGADPARYLGFLTGDQDPQHNLALPEGTTWKDGTPFSSLIPAALPVPAPAASPIDIRTENDTDWLSDQWLNDIQNFVRQDAQAENGTSVFVLYDIPDRDSGNFSAGGVDSVEKYADVVTAVAAGIGEEPALVVLEPDALGLLDGLSADQTARRYICLQRAIDILKANPNTRVAVDASMWVPAGRMAERLNKLVNWDLFSLNVSGWESSDACYSYGDALALLTNKHYVIDTSRNGRGNPHKPAWCNVTDTLVGEPPTIKTASRLCDALIWAKVPGESDGLKINGYDGDGQPNRSDIPRAGEHWKQFKDALLSGNWTAFKQEYGV